MHTSIERRTPSSTRMPVTMSVELVHDGWEETYEADAVNLSDTGIGVRGPMLPDVGQRMRCRFNFAEIGGPELLGDRAFPEGHDGTCETEGEVVWASDAGDAGEFGIRFDALEPHIGQALARWVSTLESAPSTASESSPVRRRDGRQHVRVQLDGVASPIEAEVSLTEGRRVRVEQALPFLLLGTRATVDSGAGGVRRILRSVELKIEGSVPKLVLELETTSGDSIAEGIDGSSEGPSTMADEPLDELLAQASARSLERAHAHDEALEAFEARSSSEAAHGEAQEKAELVARARAKASAKKRREDDSPRAVKLEAQLEDRDALAELGVDSPSLEESDEEGLPFVVRMRETGERIQKSVKPSLTRLSLALKNGWAAAVAASGPRLTAFVSWMQKVLEATKTQIATRLPQLAARFKKDPIKRRTTSPLAEQLDMRPTRSTGNGKRAEAAPEIAPSNRPKVPLRMILAGGLVAVALMFVVRALSAPAEAETVVHAPTLELSEDLATDTLAEAPVAIETAPIEAPVAPSAVALVPELAPPTLPGTLAAPSTEAGRLAAPTFPRVEEGAITETAVEAEDPLPAPTGRTSFGAAEVPHGRPTTLTMTLPITSIEGEANDSGFTVNLPGVNSLSRAAPIAAANPSVERAAIINSGDHAVLTVRFVPGRTPAYRVEARGSDLIVTIGR